MTEDKTSPPRPPRAEPEIIPPGAAHGRDDEHVVFVEMRRGRALPPFRPSLVTLLLIGGVIGVTLAILLVLLLGAFLISCRHGAAVRRLARRERAAGAGAAAPLTSAGRPFRAKPRPP